MTPPPAFCAPLPLSFRQPIYAFTSSKRASKRESIHPSKCTTSLPRTRTTPLCLAGNRIDPRDEAFITCSACGSDTPISASAITAKGSLSVRCEGCGVRFTAHAEKTLTITGQRLALVAPTEEEEDPRTGVVNLYISGLGPKTDAGALRAALEEFGEVTKANVVYDRVTGRSRGFGFVSIVGRSAASAAIDVLSGDTTRLGRRLNKRKIRGTEILHTTDIPMTRDYENMRRGGRGPIMEGYYMIVHEQNLVLRYLEVALPNLTLVRAGIHTVKNGTTDKSALKVGGDSV